MIYQGIFIKTDSGVKLCVTNSTVYVKVGDIVETAFGDVCKVCATLCSVNAREVNDLLSVTGEQMPERITAIYNKNSDPCEVEYDLSD